MPLPLRPLLSYLSSQLQALRQQLLREIEVEDEIKAKIKEDDVELLKFGFKWLRFSLFGEKTMTIKSNVAEDKTKELKMKGKLA